MRDFFNEETHFIIATIANASRQCSIGDEGAACSPLAPTLSTCLLSGGYGGLPVVPGTLPH